MLNLVKLCVGAASIEDLAHWQATYPGFRTGKARKLRVFHTTFQAPKRQAELSDGGSLYWVIKGFVQARQLLTGFEAGHKEDGSPCCLLMLDAKIIPVRPQPRKAFQGWRYLMAEDAPPDLAAGATLAALPPELRKELAVLGLI